jgi:hypothetical protein
MSTVACAGCGMPRAAELVGSTGCPVCGHVVSPEPAFDPPREWASPKVEPPAAPIPEPARVAAPRSPFAWGRILTATVAFAAGTAVGVAGLLAWQGGLKVSRSPETAAVQPDPVRPVAVKPAEVAPMPREVAAAVPEPVTPTPVAVAPPDPAPAILVPVPAVVPAAVPVVVKAAGRAVHIDVNEPSGTYTLTVPMTRGEHVVLKGKVGTLKIASVEAGSTLDATQLDAGTIEVSGKIDGGAVVKLNAPFGTVNVTGKVDGGSRLNVTGRVIYLHGGVGGDKTQVTAVIGRSGSLRASGVQGTAVVEYRAVSSGWSEPDVKVGEVGGGATVRRAVEKN